MSEFLLLAAKRALIQILPTHVVSDILSVRVLETQGRMEASQAEGRMWESQADRSTYMNIYVIYEHIFNIYEHISTYINI